MVTYRVELTAWLEATYTMDVEAEDETAAKQRAVETAPMKAEMWTVLPSPQPMRVEVFSCEAETES